MARRITQTAVSASVTCRDAEMGANMPAEFYADVTMTPAEVERRKTAMDAAHRAYSAAFRERETAETELSGMTQKRAALVKRCDELRAGLKTEKDAALTAAVEGSGFAPRAATLQAFRQQFDLMEQARARFDAYEYADAQRAALDAQRAELEAQKAAEEARCEHHEAKVLLLVAQASELNQGIEIQGLSDGVAGALRELVEGIRKQLTEAKKAVDTHDGETAELRQKYAEKYGE
jgi:vacuolar-type H+-ATPase subunit I/STV1